LGIGPNPQTPIPHPPSPIPNPPTITKVKILTNKIIKKINKNKIKKKK
jgi:hypothetical protein